MAFETTIKSVRERASQDGRLLLALGIVAALVLAAVLFWLMTPRYAVLFSDLADRDLAALSEQLTKKKIAFEVGEDGRSLLVPEATVHKVRMQLMAQDVNLQGNVGFELFNNSDLGMTEFVQKVNYQRALQGELARTIQSMQEVQSARVHLALAEQGLFRRNPGKGKASVTVTLKPGASLNRAQVGGIQRLVAASVPEVVTADVAVLDQRGVVLNGSGSGEEVALDDAWLDRRRSAESYLAAKATEVLNRMYGEGSNLVSVDVQLNEERRSATIEEVLGAQPQRSNGTATGVVVRERQTRRQAPAPIDTSGGDRIVTRIGGGPESSVYEYDYQVGKKVEQVQTPAGGVRRISVGVVLKAALSEAEMLRVKELVATVVGANTQRGDLVAVTTVQRAAQAGVDAAALLPSGGHPVASEVTSAAGVPPGDDVAPRGDRRPAALASFAAIEWPQPWVLGLAAAAVMLVGLLLLLARGRLAVEAGAPLDERARETVLTNVRTWLANGNGSHEAGAQGRPS